MPLSDTDLKSRLEAPKYKATIAAAIKHQNRIALHTDTILNLYGGNMAVTEYLKWVEELISEDAYRAYRALFRFPLETVPVMSEVKDKLARVFDGRDSVFSPKFNSEGNRVKYQSWRSKESIQEKWKKSSLKTMHVKCNSIIILDNDPSQGLNPYFYFLDIDRVVEFEPKKTSITELEWVVFKESKHVIIVIDDNSYRRFNIENGYEKMTLIDDVSHGLGFSPARFLVEEPLNTKDPFVKKSPYSDYLFELDWLLLFGGNKKGLDLYGSQPILSGFRADCDFSMDGSDDEDLWECNSGYLVDSNDRYVMNGTGLHRCPRCNPKQKISPGTFVRVATPSKDNDFQDLRNPISITTVDRSSLDYNHDEKEFLKSSLIKAITGYSGDPINNQAINEDQVRSFRDAETIKLVNLKGSFEQAQSWTETGLAKMLLGAGAVEAVDINYGNEFYLISAEEVASNYAKARDKSQPVTILNEIEDQYYATKYRLNPDLRIRNQMISDVEPFRHVSKQEVSQMLNLELITREEYYFKINFASLLDRFERENVAVEQFAVDLQYPKRIEKIREEILFFIKSRSATPAPPEPPEPQGGASGIG